MPVKTGRFNTDVSLASSRGLKGGQRLGSR
jgi:hypothetical protein